MNCKHKNGDWVNGYWLCAECYSKLDRRPVRYSMPPVSRADLEPRTWPDDYRTQAFHYGN